jgi:hypothetical protein
MIRSFLNCVCVAILLWSVTVVTLLENAKGG